MENEVRKSWASPQPGSTQAGLFPFPREVPWAHAKCSGSTKESDLTRDRNQDFPAAVCGAKSVASRSTHSSPKALCCSDLQEKGSWCILEDTEDVCHANSLSPAGGSDEKQLFGISQYVGSTFESCALHSRFLYHTCKLLFSYLLLKSIIQNPSSAAQWCVSHTTLYICKCHSKFWTHKFPEGSGKHTRGKSRSLSQN